MVACGLFSLLMLSTIVFYDLSQRSNRRATAHSDAYREAALAFRHIKRELKGVKLTQVGEADTFAVGDTGARLRYSIPDWRDNRIVVDLRGNPVWASEHQLWVTSDGKLMLGERPVGAEDDDDFSDSRQLADLGDGQVRFTLADPQLLEVTVEATRVEVARLGEESRRELTFTVGLANQQFWENLVILEKT
jgi:hypothetical protein